MSSRYKQLKKAVFPVGGLGTRFLPVTKALPKEMLPVASKPLIQYAFEEALEAGIEQFIFVTGRNKNAISNHFDHSYELQRILNDQDKFKELAMARDWLPPAGQIAFVRQQEPLGLGHAVWCARNFIGNEPFAVLLADELLMTAGGFLQQMCKLYAEVGSNIIALDDIDKSRTGSYGIIDIEQDNGEVVKIKSMVEKPRPEVAPSNTAIVGRYILQPEIFEHLGKMKSGAGGEIQLTDAMENLRSTMLFYGLRHGGARFDCGNQLGLLEANIAYALNDQKHKDQALEIIRKYASKEHI